MRKTRSALDSERYSVVKDRRSPLRKLRTGPLEAGPPTRGGANQTIEDLVELIGIEPTTSGLQSPRSPR